MAASGAPAKIAADNHNLMLRGDGKLFVWGDNAYGQLGLGSGAAASLHEPTENKFFSGKGLTVKDVYVVEDASFVLCSNGELYACGRGANGRLGLGDTQNRNAWTLISASQSMRFERLYGGKDFVIAVTGTNEIIAWGRNNYGQVGNGTTTDVAAPTKILASANVKRLVVGEDFSMLIKQDDSTWIWGNNAGGRYGFDSQTTNTSKTSGGYTYSTATCYGWPASVKFAPTNNRKQQLAPFCIQTGPCVCNTAFADYFDAPASTHKTPDGAKV